MQAELAPGEVLYIPALWFHNVTSVGFSVAVNVFWHSHDQALYDHKDLYGNKDPPAATLALSHAAAAAAEIATLPEPFKTFYAERAAREILGLCGADLASGRKPSDWSRPRLASVELRSGLKMPFLGAGTYRIAQEDVCDVVRSALQAGVRHIDTASAYNNESEVGKAFDEALSMGLVTREELFVTGKLWNSNHAPEKVELACRRSLTELGLDYFDLYLMHWPLASGNSAGTTLLDTWKVILPLVLSIELCVVLPIYQP